MAAPATATHDGFDHQPLPIDTSTIAHDQEACEGVELEEGQVLLHFVANQQTSTGPITLELKLEGGGSLIETGEPVGQDGQTHHFTFGPLDGDVVITDLVLSSNEGNVRLSHLCRGEADEVAGDLVLVKTDGTDVMEGVEFTLSGENLASNLTATTNASGVAIFADLAPGTYTLSESTPEGFEDIGPWTVTVAADGTVSIEGLTPNQDGSFTIVNVVDEVDNGFLEIDKILCEGTGDPTFEVIAEELPPQSLRTLSETECPTFEAQFDIIPAGSTEPLMRVTTTGGSWTDEIPAGDYFIVEVSTGAASEVFTVGEGTLTIILVTNFEEEDVGNLKVVKFDCEGEGPDGALLDFEILNEDAQIPDPEDCELGDATFRLNDPETGPEFSTVDGVVWLDDVPVGTHTLFEISPNQGSVEFTISEAGAWVTIFVFNFEGEQEEELGSITIQKEFEEGECPVCPTRTPGFWFNRGGGGGVDIANELLPGLNVTFPIGEGGSTTFDSVEAVHAFIDWDLAGGDGQTGLSGTAQLLRHYLALLLNVTHFDCPADEVAFEGMTIAEWLAAAEAVLAEGGEDEAIKDALDAINNATIGDGTLECPDGTASGAAGFTFELWADDELVDSMTTDESGSVTFSDLELGVEYTIIETAPEGLECTIVSISNDGAVLNEDGTISVTLTEENADITITVVNECEEVEVPEEEVGFLEIDKILCPGTGDPLFEVIATGVPPTQASVQQLEDECETMDATFIVTPVGADEAWGEVTTEGGTVTFEIAAGDYVLTEEETGAMSGTITVVDGALTIVLVTNFEGEGELPEEAGNLKVVKWFCDGEEDGVQFEVLDGDATITNPADCDLGNATFTLNDPESETTFTTSGGVLFLMGVPLGTHTLFEIEPNEASVEFTLTEDGGWVTIFAFNVAGEGQAGEEEEEEEEEQRGGVRGGQLPDTATAPASGGSLPAALLALVMVTGVGAAGYAMQAEARRRR